jgi:hypothetical protein
LLNTRASTYHEFKSAADNIATNTSLSGNTKLTANANAGASEDVEMADRTDPILQAVLEEEARTRELVHWFKVNCGKDLSTLDLPELEALFTEQGLGTTLPPNHMPYPNVSPMAISLF